MRQRAVGEGQAEALERVTEVIRSSAWFVSATPRFSGRCSPGARGSLGGEVTIVDGRTSPSAPTPSASE